MKEQGIIYLWHGSASSVPSGWAICDGNNSTPDLRGVHLKGISTAGTDPGTVGGQNSASLTTSQMPSHDHPVTVDGVGSHTHIWHHGAEDLEVDDFGPDEGPESGGSGPQLADSAGTHGHSASANATGSGASFENRPPHTQLHYIQKL